MCDRVEQIIRRDCQGNARRMLQRWGICHDWLDPIMERKTQLWQSDGKAWLTTRRRVVLIGNWFEYLQRRRARYCQLREMRDGGD